MRILVALIAVFMVSGAMAQDFDGNDVQFAQQKKPTGYTGGGNATCQVIGEVERRPSFQCTDPKTGKTQKVKCKNPPKQKLPPKLSMAQLAEVCGLLDENGFPYRRAGD